MKRANSRTKFHKKMFLSAKSRADKWKMKYRVVKNNLNKMCNFKLKLENLESKLKKIFNEDQLFLLKSAKQSNIGYTWDNSTIKKCSQIFYSCGKSGYEFLRELGYPLPCVRTLQIKCSKLPFEEGLLYALSPHLTERKAVWNSSG